MCNTKNMFDSFGRFYLASTSVPNYCVNHGSNKAGHTGPGTKRPHDRIPDVCLPRDPRDHTGALRVRDLSAVSPSLGRGETSIQVFFDGDCPLCRREISFLSKRDKEGRIETTDIAESDFDASRFGRSQSDFMATIQGRLADGRWITGVEVFRQLYSAVGFERAVRFSRLRPISWLLERSYTLFAKHRLRLTRRCLDSGCSIPSQRRSMN